MSESIEHQPEDEVIPAPEVVDAETDQDDETEDGA